VPTARFILVAISSLLYPSIFHTATARNWWSYLTYPVTMAR
jgi:hypothetical protein